MALTHQVIETRQYLSNWETLVDITDDTTGIVYNRRYNWGYSPSQSEIDAAIVILKARIILMLEYKGNDMNLMADEARAIEYLRNIKLEAVTQIRAFPAITQLQANTYIETNYPNSMINFDRLYAFYLQLLGLTTWDEFKTWVIDNKFIGIDE